MKIEFLTPEELRRILNEELDKRFGPMSSSATIAPREDPLISTAEACRLLGCSSRTMQRYRDAKLFTVVMNGPHRCSDYRSEILAFRDQRTRSSRDN